MNYYMKADPVDINLMYQFLKSTHTELSYDNWYGEKSLKNCPNFKPQFDKLL